MSNYTTQTESIIAQMQEMLREIREDYLDSLENSQSIQKKGEFYEKNRERVFGHKHDGVFDADWDGCC